MTQEKDDKKPLAKEPGEESSQEMEIIKDLFSSEELPLGTELGSFEENLFGGEEEKLGESEPDTRGEQPSPVKESEPAPPRSSPSPSIREESAPSPETKAEDKKSEPASPGGAGETIKIITDDDLRQLFEQSSPGFRKEEIEEPGEEAEAEIPSAPSPPSEQEKEEAKSEAAPSEPAAKEEPPAPAEERPSPQPDLEAADQEARQEHPLEDLPAEQIVEDLESRIQVGEMTAVPTAKKGETLEKTARLLEELEPASEDFMNVAELKKLFNNVNILIKWAGEISERLAKIEKKLESED